MKLELQGASARHPAARPGAAPALMALDLRVAPGEQVAVIGPSGAGKTTLLQVLACAMPPATGALRLDGQDPWQLPRAELQRATRFVPTKAENYKGIEAAARSAELL